MFHSPWKNQLISNRKWVLRSRVLRNRKWHCTGSASQISRAAACLGTPQIDRSLKFVSLIALVHFCSGTQTDHSTALTKTTAMRCRHWNLAVSKSIVCKAYRTVYRFEKMLWSCSHFVPFENFTGAYTKETANTPEFSIMFSVWFILLIWLIYMLTDSYLWLVKCRTTNSSCHILWSTLQNTALIVGMAVWENPSDTTLTEFWQAARY